MKQYYRFTYTVPYPMTTFGELDKFLIDNQIKFRNVSAHWPLHLCISVHDGSMLWHQSYSALMEEYELSLIALCYENIHITKNNSIHRILNYIRRLFA